MFSKKLFTGILGATLALGITLCVVLSLTLGGNDENLKINQSQIEIAYGDTFNLSNVTQVLDKFAFKIKDTNIAKIENNKIKTLACGKTKLYVSKRSSQKEIELVIYANSVSFDKSTINLHTSGFDTFADFSLLVNNLPYTNCEYSFDDNIISVENNCICAKTAGKTQVLATMLGISGDITANLDIYVKNYVYAEDISSDTIYMNVDTRLNKSFIDYENVVGDKINAEIIYDKNYLSYKNNILTALKVGSTQITVSTLLDEDTIISRTINVEIAPQLDVIKYSFSKNDTEIDTLHYSIKADGTLELYKLHLAFNKPILGSPTFSGIVASHIESTGSQTFDVTFTKADASKIIVSATDPNTNCADSFDLKITQQKFIQTIDCSFVDDNNTSRDCLYLFNNDYETSANEDGCYSSLIIKTSIDNVIASNGFTITTDAINIEIEILNDKYIVNALSVGIATITISATDGSGVVCTKNINVGKVVLSNIKFAEPPKNLFLYDTFSLAPTFEPEYALTDFEITFENGKTISQYFLNNEFNFQATAYGSSIIKICENDSTLEHTYNLTISQEYIFCNCETIFDSENAVLTIPANTATSIMIWKRTTIDGAISRSSNLSDVIITLFDQSKTIIYSTKENFNEPAPFISKLENEIFFDKAPIGNYSLQITKGGKVVATLKIIIE